MCSSWNARDRTRFENQLDDKYRNTASYPVRVDCNRQEQLLNLSASKMDYKNWVELAVSFDK